MEQERWQRLKHLVYEAMDRSDAATYLNETCAGDDDLRREAERLLELHRQSGLFLDQPLWPVRDR